MPKDSGPTAHSAGYLVSEGELWLLQLFLHCFYSSPGRDNCFHQVKHNVEGDVNWSRFPLKELNSHKHDPITRDTFHIRRRIQKAQSHRYIILYLLFNACGALRWHSLLTSGDGPLTLQWVSFIIKLKASFPYILIIFLTVTSGSLKRDGHTCRCDMSSTKLLSEVYNNFQHLQKHVQEPHFHTVWPELGIMKSLVT